MVTKDCEDCHGVGKNLLRGTICHTCQGVGKLTFAETDDTYGAYFWVGWNMEVAAAMTIIRSIGFHEGCASMSLPEQADSAEEQECQPA